MKVFRASSLFFVYAACAIACVAPAFADTIIMNDGKEIKGIVIEDYKDRVLFSTVDGEITLMKSDIRELSFDSEEDNLVKLAEQASERRDYARAMGYYEMALKANPDSAAAKKGMVYLRGNIFRKEETLKSAEIKRQQNIELYGGQAAMLTGSDDIADMAKALEKSTGIRISMAGSIPEIEAVKAGSPAYEAGLRKGDLLASVWGKLTDYLALKETLDLLVNRSAVEIQCVFARTVAVNINPNKTIISGLEDLIGASFAMEIDGLTISAVKDAGSAIGVGIEKGDLVTEIDGKQTRYMPLKKAVELIKNSDASVVKLAIKRKAIIWRRSDL
jgi:hypothetical protein